METAQIMMMPMASTPPATAGNAGIGCVCSGAEAGFGSLLGQTLELLQQSGISLPTATLEAAPEVTVTNLSPETLDTSGLLEQLVAGADGEGTKEPTVAKSGEQEAAQQLAGFLQAAMLVPMTTPVVNAKVEGGAEAVVMPIADVTPAVAIATVLPDVSEVASADSLVTIQQQEQVVEGLPQTLATAAHDKQEGITLPQAALKEKMSALNSSMKLTQPVESPEHQAVVDDVRTIPTPPESAKVSLPDQMRQVAVVAEARSSATETPAVLKGVSAHASPVRFAQQSDVVAATAQPEQQQQQDMQNLTQGSDEQKTAQVKISTGEPAGEVFDLQAQPSSLSTAGHGLAPVNQHQTRVPEMQAVADQAKAVPESQVMRQVTDRLAAHEIKQGADQISLKLSPEHLGNLQLNLRMNDQQVRVEIVAEHRAVREALLQQVDQLKESLTRQNIKMESFDVTTTNGGLMQQQAGDWRQTASERRPLYAQQQYGAGKTVGTTDVGSGAGVQYFAPQYQSTLDVRF